jgi:hypothetical protein
MGDAAGELLELRFSAGQLLHAAQEQREEDMVQMDALHAELAAAKAMLHARVDGAEPQLSEQLAEQLALLDSSERMRLALSDTEAEVSNSFPIIIRTILTRKNNSKSYHN